MEQDELAQQFQLHRKQVLQRGSRRFPSIEPDILDMIYTDRWFALQKVSIHGNLRNYIQTAFNNGVRNYVRDKRTSQDLFERGIPHTEQYPDDEEAKTPFIETIIDTRSDHAAIEFEAKCQWVEDAMKHIPITLRLIGWWSIVDGEPHREIAKRFNCSKQNISLKLIQFRKLLKIELDKCPQP